MEPSGDLAHFSTEPFGDLALRKCRRCPFLCLSAEDAGRHSHLVHSEAPFAAADALLSCPACPDRFFTADFFGSHLHYHHRAAAGDAEAILAVFSDKLRQNANAALTIPGKKKNSRSGRPNGARSRGAVERGFACPVGDCGARLSLPESVDYHETCHVDGAKELRCPECERRFASLETLHNHLWKEHRVDLELHKCDRCPYRTYSSSRLENVHKKIHSEEKNYGCDACPMAFKNGKQLANHRDRHRKREGASRRYPCDVCRLEMSSPRHLAAHKRNVHDKVKPFACRHCDYSAGTGSSLRLHVRSHTGEKPYACSECDSKFSDRSTLRRHLMQHAERKPYECDLCSYGCIQASSIKAHLKLKHPGAETGLLHPCAVCPYVSVSEKNYRAHLATHSSRPVDPDGSDKTPKISVKSNLVLKGSADRDDSVLERGPPQLSDFADAASSPRPDLFDGRSPYSFGDDYADASFAVPDEFFAPTRAKREDCSDDYADAFPERESKAGDARSGSDFLGEEFEPPAYSDAERAEIVIADDASCDMKSSFFGNYA